jgi:hypothetical protein
MGFWLSLGLGWVVSKWVTRVWSVTVRLRDAIEVVALEEMRSLLVTRLIKA